MAAGVAHFARITCTCGTFVDVESYAVCSPVGGWLQRCQPEIEYSMPDGWLGGYDDKHPPQCPECVHKEYGT